MIHTGFLRPSLIDHVNMPRIDGQSLEDQSRWSPYPNQRSWRPSYIDLYFHEASELSTIARDISQSMFGEDHSRDLEPAERQSREMLYEQLQRWEELLPESFSSDNLPPHIILLK